MIQTYLHPPVLRDNGTISDTNSGQSIVTTMGNSKQQVLWKYYGWENH